MIVHVTYFLLVCFVAVQSSDGYPVGAPESEQESQGVARLFVEDNEPVNAVPEEFDGEDVNVVKGEGDDEWSEGKEQDLQQLSPNTADTMRKINPLTIADQVSRMFRKGGQRVNIVNKSGGGFLSQERGLARGQETHGDQSLAISAVDQSEDSPIEPGYVRQAVPRIVNKPRSNDYGYSVIVLAGDAVHLPIKVQGKTARGQGRGTPEDKDKDGPVYRTGEAEEKIGLGERKKEVRVYKQFSKNPDFPVYDEDLSFVPDPLQGILDDNYRLEVDKANKKPVLPMESFRPVDNEMRLHKVRVRSDEDVESGEKKGEKVACGSWGKGNITESEVISFPNIDNIDGNQ